MRNRASNAFDLLAATAADLPALSPCFIRPPTTIRIPSGCVVPATQQKCTVKTPRSSVRSGTNQDEGILKLWTRKAGKHRGSIFLTLANKEGRKVYTEASKKDVGPFRRYG
jgi:hypothetical protein